MKRVFAIDTYMISTPFLLILNLIFFFKWAYAQLSIQHQFNWQFITPSPVSNANFLSASDFSMHLIKWDQQNLHKILDGFTIKNQQPAAATVAQSQKTETNQKPPHMQIFISLFWCFYIKIERHYLDNVQCVERLVCLEIQYSHTHTHTHLNQLNGLQFYIRKSVRSTLCINTLIFVGLPSDFDFTVRAFRWMQPCTSLLDFTSILMPFTMFKSCQFGGNCICFIA